MKTRRYFKQFLLASSVVGLSIAAASHARAAFEWTPPQEVVAEEPSLSEENAAPEDMLPVVPSAEEIQTEEILPEVSVQEEIILEDINENDIEEDLRQIIEEATESNVITPVADIPESEQIDEVPQNIVVEPIAEQVLEDVKNAPKQSMLFDSVQDTPKQDSNFIQGFGRDLPLITAVRQIVPTDVPYAFGESLDLAQLVSWEGGETWQETLLKIAKDNNLKVDFSNHMVRISNADTTISESEASPEIETVRLESIQTMEEPTEKKSEEGVKVVIVKDDVSVSAEGALRKTQKPLKVAQQAVTENEVLEATISDAIVISPIEDMQTSVPLPEKEGTDVLSEVTEGAVIEPIDPPSQETLQRANKEAKTSRMTDEMKMAELEDPAMSMIDQVVADMQEDRPAKAIVEPVPLQITEPAPIEVSQDASAADLTEDVKTSIPAQNQMKDTSRLSFVKTWKVKKNSDLKTTLEAWSQEVGVNLLWKMDKDYVVNYMVWVDGNYEEAVDVLMQGYENQKGLIPVATLQMGPSGPVLVIEPAA